MTSWRQQTHQAATVQLRVMAVGLVHLKVSQQAAHAAAMPATAPSATLGMSRSMSWTQGRGLLRPCMGTC